MINNNKINLNNLYNQNQAQIFHLPKEILKEIFRNLSISEQAKFALTCKKAFQLFPDNSFIKTILLLKHFYSKMPFPIHRFFK